MAANCQCSDDEVESLAQEKTSAGYVAVEIILTVDDIEHIKNGGCIFAVCNQEYGIKVSFRHEVRDDGV